MDETLRELVRLRSGNRCEYCLIRQEHIPLTKLQVEHIVARQHAGEDDLTNLALACDRCNLHKGPNLTGIDPVSGDIVPLFHPRRDNWDDHFQWGGVEIIGLTPKGRTTVRLLQMNDSRRLRLRTTLRWLGQLHWRLMRCPTDATRTFPAHASSFTSRQAAASSVGRFSAVRSGLVDARLRRHR